MRNVLNGHRSLALLTVLACLATGMVHAQTKPLPTVTPNELKDRLAGEQPPLLLDVRSEKEYLAGHVPGAINLPIDELADRLAELGAYKERGVPAARYRAARRDRRDASGRRGCRCRGCCRSSGGGGPSGSLG